ncbi:MAG: hypothetical protein DWQ10_02745 [Calditrichaeota bacterium]|nr:MAG: hypothetical protein DWQ10_02745 [Calditrichota bacterium]
MNTNNEYPIDMAYTARTNEREKQIREKKERDSKADREKYYELKIQYEQLTNVSIPSALQEQERINQELQEPPAVPQESVLKLDVMKAFTYAGLALIMGFAGILLTFTILAFVFYSFGAVVRWLIAAACIGLTIVGFHWAIRNIGLKMRKLLIVFLLIITVANIGAWAWIRAEYSSITHLQENDELTAEQAQERMKTLDAILVFVHITFALAIEGIAALCVNRAVELYDASWPGLSKYRRRRNWERIYAAQLKEKIALENQMQRLEPTIHIQNGVKNEN